MHPNLAPILLGGRRPSLNLNFLNGVLDGRITASGGANGAVTNSSGALVAATTPRFDFDPVTLAAKGALIEESRTNLLLNSLLNGTNLSTQSVALTAQAYTLSFYGTGTVTLSGASTAGPLTGTGAYPTRSSLTFTPTAGSVTFTVTGTVQYAQLEAGSFATSFIPTAAASVTRTADSLVMTGSNFSSWYPAGGCCGVIEFRIISVTGTRPIWSFDDNTANQQILLYASGTSLKLTVTDAGVAQADLTLGTIAASTVYKAAFRVSPNDFAAVLSGGAVQTDGSGTVPAVDRARIGSDQAGNFQDGHVLKSRIYTPLTNSTLQAMTA